LDDADRKQLRAFVKHWLRQVGRTPGDLGQALGLPAAPLSMLLNELVRTNDKLGPSGLVERLCLINERWECPEDFDPDPAVLGDQLDLLLETIQGGAGSGSFRVRPSSSRPMSPPATGWWRDRANPA